jgi:hypothetical protein
MSVDEDCTVFLSAKINSGNYVFLLKLSDLGEMSNNYLERIT